jgi:hypothetical protein
MGYAKQQEMEREAQDGVATSIAVAAGVMTECPIHEDVVMEGGADPVDAYRLGNAMFTRGEVALFESRREMTDALKRVMAGYRPSECFRCEAEARE